MDDPGGFLFGLTAGVLADVGGWMTTGIISLTFALFLARGWLVTRGQHLKAMADAEAAHMKAMEAKDVVIATQKEQFEKRLQEYEEHYDALLALKRESYDVAYAMQKETYEARLSERSEVLEESRENFAGMMEVAQSYGTQIAALARSAETTERLLLALDDALDLTKGGENGQGR